MCGWGGGGERGCVCVCVCEEPPYCLTMAVTLVSQKLGRPQAYLVLPHFAMTDAR